MPSYIDEKFSAMFTSSRSINTFLRNGFIWILFAMIQSMSTLAGLDIETFATLKSALDTQTQIDKFFQHLRYHIYVIIKYLRYHCIFTLSLHIYVIIIYVI